MYNKWILYLKMDSSKVSFSLQIQYIKKDIHIDSW